MGGSIGKVFKSVGGGGSVVGGLGDVFSDKGDTVKGTGQTVGDLKKLGYSADDIKAMGGAKPSSGVGFSRGILRGALTSFPAGPTRATGGPPVAFDASAPMFDTGGYLGAANPYLNPSLMGARPGLNPNALGAFYGG